jgi:hypothetical protein
MTDDRRQMVNLSLQHCQSDPLSEGAERSSDICFLASVLCNLTPEILRF